ncbi:hypothetical protein [Roseinatronobacter sp. S2]|nr:hypothetical protein [Roseinatronobacter sp. S2]WFE74707.1 hypothetical protein P8S53_16155 [Roseinatronobacter sp. S2]
MSIGATHKIPNPTRAGDVPATTRAGVKALRAYVTQDKDTT